MKPEYFNDEKAAERIYLTASNVEEELAKNPSWMNYYSSQAAKWQAIADLKKIEAKERRGVLAKELRASGVKVTGAILEAEQDADPEYVNLMKTHIKAKEQAEEFTGAHYALDKKQFSLQALNKRNDRDEVLQRAQSYQGKKDELVDRYR